MNRIQFSLPVCLKIFCLSVLCSTPAHGMQDWFKHATSNPYVVGISSAVLSGYVAWKYQEKRVSTAHCDKQRADQNYNTLKSDTDDLEQQRLDLLNGLRDQGCTYVIEHNGAGVGAVTTTIKVENPYKKNYLSLKRFIEKNCPEFEIKEEDNKLVSMQYQAPTKYDEGWLAQMFDALHQLGVVTQTEDKDWGIDQTRVTALAQFAKGQNEEQHNE